MIDEVGRDPGYRCCCKVLAGHWSPAPAAIWRGLGSQPRGETAAGGWEHLRSDHSSMNAAIPDTSDNTHADILCLDGTSEFTHPQQSV